ncbi:unnamed protein product, partial [Symbiodinium necroappetens]
ALPGSLLYPSASAYHSQEAIHHLADSLQQLSLAIRPEGPPRSTIQHLHQGSLRSLTGAGSTPLARATRAWTSGLWAKLVLEDQAFLFRASVQRGRRLRPPVGAMTDLATFVTLADGQLRFLALSWPEEGRTVPVPEAVCVPVMKRQEGLLLCIPCGFLSLATLDEGENADAHSLVGPSHQCTVPFAVSDEQGVEQPLEMEGSVLLVDFGARVLPQLRDLGEDIISDALFPFDLHQLEAVPMSEELLAVARRWASVTQADRAAFYSAVEDQAATDVGAGGKAKAKRAAPKKKVTAADLAQQMSFLTAMLPQLAEQLTAVKEKQEDLEKKVQPGPPDPAPSPAKPAHQMPFLPPRGPGLPVAKQASLVGPPPRTRNQDAPPVLAAPLPLAAEPAAAGVGAVPQDSFQAAMLQQSQALTALVGHLMSQQDGGLGDLSASSSTSYVGSKGAARRERLQAALANRSGDFYLAVLQAAATRLTPSSPAPASLGECLGQVSMCQYFERFGGFAGQRETGYTMWCLAHVMDCLTSEDYAGAREFLAVTVVALDQSALDGGRWDFAWLLTLLEEPPAQLFHGRGAVANPRTRAFSPLSPVGWTTCALQYLKEVDLITTRRLESLGSHRQPAAPPAADTEGQDGNKPKRLSRPAPPSGVIFPVPLPFAGVFARFPLDCSSRVRRRIMHRRLVHIVCMALNFLHANFVPIPLPMIQRPMNVAQRCLVAHVGRHLKAFGASVGEFVLAGSGRRNPQLIARLSELMSFLAASAATGDSYADRSGTVVPTHNEAHPGLDPFRSLDVSRLKLSGQGLWDPTPYLPDELFMAFSEPRSLLHGRPPPDSFVPVWTRECPQEVASLAAMWDRLGLLRLAPASLLESEAYLLARAFNCYKAPDKDRMIIDRRGQNWAESRLPGPSLFIPVGPMLGMLEVDPARQTVYCAASDRKDFYHQIAAPPAKALSNVLGPALPRESVCNLAAFGHVLPSLSGLGCAGGPRHRLAPPKRGSLLFEPNHYLVCFGAIAQGDHLGVEVGSASHEGLLLSGGLLSEDVRLCSNRPFKGIARAQGLVIDDFFSISVSDLADGGPPPCVDDLHRAKAIYAAAELAGSDDKDVWGEQRARIAGAEINSGPHARALNIVTVAAPAAKRVALALLSLEAARLSHVTDTLWLSLVGSWTSAALFRRPFMSIFSEVYRVAPASHAKAARPTLYPLPRPAAQEVVLASVLSPLAACDLAAPFRAELFATDASEAKGGYTVAKAGVDLIRPLWRTASKKGGYSRLLSKEEAVLTRFEDREPFDLRMVSPTSQTDPGRPLAYYFDVLEVGASGGQVSAFLSSWGRSVGPVFAVEVSPVYDLAQALDVLRAFRCLALLLSARGCSVPALLLQAASILRLIRALAPSGPCRVVILVDSAVAATCLLAGVFPAFHFVPTRLNPGDCPTRDLPLPEPCPCAFWPSLTTDELYEGLSLPKLRRWASNWARLVFLCIGAPPVLRPSLGWRVTHRTSRLFDSSLGFPGEGPFFRVFWVWFGIVGSYAATSHVLRPRNPADERRSRARSATVLVEGRPVEPVTKKRREKLLQAFSAWLTEQGADLESLLDLSPLGTKKLNSFLVCYGRQLFDAGWPYSHYSEVINAVSSKEPGVRRCLQPSWDLAFAWLREEPHSHHVALPWQVLVAAITLSLLWGWPRVAGMLAMTWGSVMRIGESLAACRRDLLLPGDVCDTMAFALISISEPKTRFRAARHQSAKLDQPDLLEVVHLAFGHLSLDSKLWPFSASTLRCRFDALMDRLGANTWAGQGSRALDLGSLRAGGATWLLQVSEDSELVRRRGRWLNSRTMEIYIQEISALQFMHRLAPQSRFRVFSLVDSFRKVLSLAQQLQASSTPTSQWYTFFAGGMRHMQGVEGVVGG